MTDLVTTLTETTFDEEVRAADVPMLIDFWAENCPPCRAIAPVLEELAEEYEDRLLVRKVDTDAEPDLARRFQVMSVPTLVVIHGNRLVRELVGSRPKGQLVKELGDLLSDPDADPDAKAESEARTKA